MKRARLSSPINPGRGSAMVAVIIVLMITAGVSAMYLQTSTHELRYTHNLALRQHAINIAEAGAELGLNAINEEDWNGWTISGNLREKHFQLGSGMIGPYAIRRVARVKVHDVGTFNPIIETEGAVTRGNLTQRRQIRIELRKRSPFDNGLTARGRIQFIGNNTYVDSYNSNDGAYDPDNHNDNGSVASMSAEVGDVDIQHATIYGYVATGGEPPKVGTQGKILGFDSPEGAIDPARVSTDFHADFEAPVAPSEIYVPYLGGGVMGIEGEQTFISAGNINLASVDDTLTIHGDVVLNMSGNLRIRGKLELAEGATLTLYTSGNIDLAGNGELNNSDVPGALQIYGTSSGPVGGEWQNFTLGGNAVLKAAVYAPNSNLSMGGGGATGVAMGAIVANRITLAGNYKFHYDEALSEISLDEAYRMMTWRELLNHDERVTFADP